jgi:hypothetical protein
MKKTLLLTLALASVGVSPLMAGTVNVYITGSTAFRANVYTACTKLFDTSVTNPFIAYGDAAHGGAGSGFSSKTAAWAMSGTPIASLTNIQGNTLIIHGLFTGSVQGIQTTVNNTPLTFPNADGTSGGLCATYNSTAAPTIGFSDASGAASPYFANGTSYVEEKVAVQPFIFMRANSGGVLTNINNVSWEQLEYGIPQGRIPLAAWTAKSTDTNSFVYLLQRTKDSGTRRCETAGMYYQFNDTVGIYLYDTTAKNFYIPTVTSNITGTATAPYGIVGSAGLNNANLNWGYGYVAGGDIATTLKVADTQNTSFAMLSVGDANGIGGTNLLGDSTWGTAISFDGIWPTTAGAGIRTNGIHATGFIGAATNDYSPIINGYYPLWGEEVLVHPIGTQVANQAGNNITATQLGDWKTPGSFMGVFNGQTLNFTNLNGVPHVGSIENEIELSKTNMATAIRLSDMVNSRSAVGGTISPKFQ